MGVGRIKRVGDVSKPVPGSHVRVRRGDGSVVEGVVSSDGTLDSGHAFNHAAGDRLLRYQKPERAPHAAPKATASASSSYSSYINVAAHVLSLSAVLFLSLKLFGFV